MKRIIPFFLFISSFYGCSHIVDAPWNNTPVPVVYSIISPNEITQVYLNKTYNSNLPIEKSPYPQAKVFICGVDSNWVELSRLQADTCIFEDKQQLLKVEKGKTYYLKIELDNSIIHAQTTVPSNQLTIKDVNCVTDGTTNNSLVNGQIVKNYVCRLDLSFEGTPKTDSGFFISAFSQHLYGSTNPDQQNFLAPVFYCPTDTSSFEISLTTIDPYFSKYLNAQSINSLQSDYSANMVSAITQTFGGVLPPFSNIENGVGLFGSSVTDNRRVKLIKPVE